MIDVCAVAVGGGQLSTTYEHKAMNTNIDVSSEVTQAEAELLGAFLEDALSEEDALASVGDDAESPADALRTQPAAGVPQ